MSAKTDDLEAVRVLADTLQPFASDAVGRSIQCAFPAAPIARDPLPGVRGPRNLLPRANSDLGNANDSAIYGRSRAPDGSGGQPY